jgi:hypothetical protein
MVAIHIKKLKNLHEWLSAMRTEIKRMLVTDEEMWGF